jgi:hypothetical protein
MAPGTRKDTWGGSNNLFRSGEITGAVTELQRFVRRVGVNPNPVSSARTITVNTAEFLSYDTHVVTGSEEIRSLAQSFPCVGILRLVVGKDASWSTYNSTDNGGNIIPLTTEPRRAGTVVTLLWEPLVCEGKWLEV